MILYLRTPGKSGAWGVGATRIVELAKKATRTGGLWHNWGVIAVEQRHEEQLLLDQGRG